MKGRELRYSACTRPVIFVKVARLYAYFRAQLLTARFNGKRRRWWWWGNRANNHNSESWKNEHGTADERRGPGTVETNDSGRFRHFRVRNRFHADPPARSFRTIVYSRLFSLLRMVSFVLVSIVLVCD